MSLNEKTEMERRAKNLIYSIREIEKGLDPEERAALQSKYIAGVNRVIDMLDKIILQVPTALHLATLVLREAQKYPEFKRIMDENFVPLEAADPVTAAARAGLIASRFHHHMLERIALALYASKELFLITNLEEPIDTIIDSI